MNKCRKIVPGSVLGLICPSGHPQTIEEVNKFVELYMIGCSIAYCNLSVKMLYLKKNMEVFCETNRVYGSPCGGAFGKRNP